MDSDDERLMKMRLRYKESDVATLTDMGFTREQAIQGLVQNGNNVCRAVDALVATGGRRV